MSSHSLPALHSTRRSRLPAVWLQSRPLWAGIAITMMWLAVLFVGIFGADIVNQTPGGNSSSVPVVVAVAVFALLGTLVVGRGAFTVTSADDDLRRALEDEQVALTELAEQVSALRETLQSPAPNAVADSSPPEH